MTSFAQDALQLFELILAVVAIGGLIWKVAKMESRIYVAIDSLKDGMQDRLNRIEQSIALQQVSLENRSQIFNHQLELVEHKLNARIGRVSQGLTEVRFYLENTTGFSCRGDVDDREDY